MSPYFVVSFACRHKIVVDMMLQFWYIYFIETRCRLTD
nr:MAG TPA: hypothetical protein [Caudoviricetes sp.]